MKYTYLLSGYLKVWVTVPFRKRNHRIKNYFLIVKEQFSKTKWTWKHTIVSMNSGKFVLAIVYEVLTMLFSDQSINWSTFYEKTNIPAFILNQKYNFNYIFLCKIWFRSTLSWNVEGVSVVSQTILTESRHLRTQFLRLPFFCEVFLAIIFLFSWSTKLPRVSPKWSSAHKEPFMWIKRWSFPWNCARYHPIRGSLRDGSSYLRFILCTLIE